MPMLARRPKTPPLATLQTELGIKIKVTKSHKMAEVLASAYDEAQVVKDRLKRNLEELQKQMGSDELRTIKARAKGGGVYEFHVEEREDVLKVKRLSDTAAPVVEKDNGQ